MVNYNSSKIVYLYAKSAPQGFTVSTTHGYQSQVLAEISRSYKNWTTGQNKAKREYYDYITDVGINNLMITIFSTSSVVTNKQELNDFKSQIDYKLTHPIIDVIKRIKPDISEITIKRYSANYTTLLKHFEEPFFYDNTKQVIKYLDDKYSSDETKKNFYKSLIATIYDVEDCKKKYQAELMRLSGIVTEQNDKNEMSLAQTKNWIPYPEISMAFEALEFDYMDSGLPTTEFIIASFYAGKYFAPYRVMELLNLKYRNFVSTDNWIDFKANVIVLNIYKTASVYGQVIQKIPASFKNILKRYCVGHTTDYLLEQNGKQYTYDLLTKALKSSIGCGANIARHSFVTYLHDTGKLKTNTQIKMIAKQMRNSFQQILEYRKFNAIDDE